ncbi:MAG TPA: hypothetical protein DDX81_00460 [Desulfofustis sp.]|nr:hypothetical protein [Desulfofustis sp.]
MAKGVRIDNLDIVFRKINRHFKQGANLQHDGADAFNPPVQSPVHLFSGTVDAALGLGRNDINHRLGLGKIDPPVEKGTLGKLPRLSESGAALYHQGKN